MAVQLIEEIDNYWTNRAEGYSKVNKEELEGNQKRDWFNVIRENIEEVYRGHKAEDIKVLDIGTGPGFFAIIMAEAGYNVTAVDYTEAMLWEANENAGELADKHLFERMNAQELNF